MNKTNIKISLSINFIVVVLVLISCIIMFTGFKFMHGTEIILDSTKLGMLKFFTVESNIFMGISALFFAVNEIKVLTGKKKEISKRNYILKLMSTTAVGLTFFVVFAYLGPIATTGISSLLMNSNLFFHLVIPVLSILNFVLFEKTDKLKFINTLYGIVPTVVYGYYYLFNILIHMENGIVSPIYDWYWFVQYGVWTAIIVVPIMITYIISCVLWRANRNKVV